MWFKLFAVLVGLLLGYWYFQDEQLETLKGKRVLVTGASTGIGEQVAYQLAGLGCHVTVTSRRLEALQKVTKRCKELSPQNYTHYAVVADMQELKSTKTVIEQAVASMGGLDMIVLNHIKLHSIAVFTGSPENITLFDQIIDVNFKSYVHLASYALPHLLANEGYVIAVSSMLGKQPHPFLMSYTASKHAINGFFSALQNQFLALGRLVSVTICHLGFIGTENAVHQLKEAGQERLLQSVPAADPVDTARAIVVAAARREHDMYYPYWKVRSTFFLRNLFQEQVDSVMRYMFRLDNS